MSLLHLWEIDNPMLLSSFIPKHNSCLTSVKDFMETKIYNEIKEKQSPLVYFKWFRETLDDDNEPGTNKIYNGIWLFFIHKEERLNIIISPLDELRFNEEEMLKDLIKKHKFTFGI
jgi:hypothetical protein